MVNFEDCDDIVISGMDGKFPKCENMDKFGWSLFNKIDTSTEDEVRWTHNDYPTMPKSKYMIEELNKFDATLFKIHPQQADALDPQIRILLELAYSAILDAGVHPASLMGSQTGVFTATSHHDLMCSVFNEPNPPPHGYSVLGTSSTFLANRISYALDLKGPSLIVDSACSASITALSMAVNAMRLNQCDAALVLSANLKLNPNLILHMQTLEIISPDGKCWSFDEKGNGFATADAIVALFLQKRKNAKRIYADVVHVLCNNDGYKTIGLTTPSGVMQSKLLSKVYEEAHIDPLDVKYVEAHMTGTVQGDLEECFSIDETFNRNRKGPLLVGAVKPNLGHCEASAGLSSIAKVIHAFETGIIPATINVTNIRKDIPSLTDGRLKVCTENTKLPSPLVAINSAGFGGSNGHVLLRQWSKMKDLKRNDLLPRLVTWSGRTKESVSTIINKVKSIPLDYEFIGLLHEIQKVQIPENQYRGFGVFNNESDGNLPVCLSEKSVRLEEVQRQIVWLFTGMGCQWVAMGKSLMQIQPFYKSILMCQKVLKKFSIDLVSMITTDDEHIFDSILNSLVGITCIQVAMVDMLRLLEIPVDFIIGHSNGELAAAYADGSATLKQTVLLAYYKGKLESDGKTIDGSMAAVGLGYKQIKDQLPPTVFVGCHNSSNSCTLSGPRDDVLEFVEKLKSEKIFAEVIKSIKIAFHSKYVHGMVPEYEQYVRDIVPNPILRSSKWISSSVPFEQWETDLGKYYSVEYLVNNFKNPVLLEEASEHLPKNAIIIEIGPHGLLQAIMRRSFSDAVNVPLARRNSPNNAATFMDAFGQLFTNGVNIRIDRLYPQIEFPVSRGTPMISPLIDYEHGHNYSVRDLWSISKNNSFERKVTIDIAQEQYQYLSEHMVDDTCFMPGATLCYTVWETLAILNSVKDVSEFNVEFANIRFHRPITLIPGEPIQLIVLILTNGDFEVNENRKPVITGSIKHLPHPSSPLKQSAKSIDGRSLVLNHDDIYKELKLRGYKHRGIFAGLHTYCVDDGSSTIRWNGYWDVFIDSMLHHFIISANTRTLNYPLSIRKIRINAVEHSKWATSMEDSKMKLCRATHCKETNTIFGGGIEISGIKMLPVERRRPFDVEVLEEYQFVPLMDDTNIYSVTDAIRICTELVIEKLLPKQISVFEALDDQNEPIIEEFRNVISVTPLVNGHFMLITDRDFEISSVKIQHPNDMDRIKNTIVIWNAQNSDASSVIENVSQQGFLIIVMNNDKTANYASPTDFTLISIVPCASYSLFVFQRNSISSDELNTKVIRVLSKDRQFKWLKEIKTIHQEPGKAILLSERDKATGLLGLFKTLRVEPSPTTYVCVVVDDENAPAFDLNHPFYRAQLDLGLPVNVFKNGQWGTYRHLEFKEDEMQEKSYDSLCLQASQSGNLKSIKWVPNIHSNSDGIKVRVHYAGLSQRDLLLATRQIPQNTLIEDKIKQFDTYGREFSGIAENGQQVMGMTLDEGTLASEIICSSDDFIFNIPESMTLKEAASIPIAYLTTYSAFFIGSSINAGQKCLIHDGFHYMGLAAIQIALSSGVDVYTTVTSKNEKDFLLQHFSALRESNVEISTDDRKSYFDRVKFDVVLCFQLEDQIEASALCLIEGGTLIAVEPTDVPKMVSETLFKMGINFKSVSLEKLILNSGHRKRLVELFNIGLKHGIIKPLPSKYSHANHIESIFLTMSTENITEKVIVMIPEQCEIEKMKVKPKFVANPKAVYVIPGGLGGLGLELTNWLIMRGAKTIVLSSRRGPSNAHQHYRMRFWKSLGCNIIISTQNISTHDGCKALLQESESYGSVAGIFILAGALYDNILMNQTPTSFIKSLAPKAYSTMYLDELSRTMCPELEYFVAFSSVVSSRGSAGQANYAMANSIVDQIIENRVQQNLPGKAIRYGPITDCGMIIEMIETKNIHGVIGLGLQRPDRCFHHLDDMLHSKSAIVSIVQVLQGHEDEQLTLFSHILQIFGLKDVTKIRMSSKISDLGGDSLIVSEIKQILERELNLVLSVNEVIALSIGNLKELTDHQMPK